jgi:hypothetical protein
MSDYVTVELIGHTLESVFWPFVWILTYVCVLALLWAAIEQLYACVRHGQPIGPASSRQKLGLALILVGVLGLAVDSAVWAALIGDLGRGVGLLTHIHDAQDLRELALLALSTISLLVADIGSVLMLDMPALGGLAP